jgi:hypothetical protein
MTPLQKIRFVTANFSLLQGLKVALVGVFLTYANIFNDAQIGKANRDLTVPSLLFPVFIALFVWIQQYYRKTFGRVESYAKTSGKDVIIFLGFLVIAWAVFAVDSLEWIPISFFGIFLAMVLLFSHLSMIRQAGLKNMALFPAGLICIALISLSAFLPLLGKGLYQPFGFQSAISFVGVVVGILYTLYGVLSHIFLVRSMPIVAVINP